MSESRSLQRIARAIERIESNLGFLERNNLLEKGGTEAALKKKKTTVSLGEAVGQADFVTESVPENLRIKKKVFKEITVAPEHTILAEGFK